MKVRIITKNIALLYLLLTQIFSGYAQNDQSKWFFGAYAGLDFMSSPPVTLTTGLIGSGPNTESTECATVSDALGNLLFYTDGMTVWTSNHTVMANGGGLLTWSNQFQNCIIVKKPGAGNIFYIFCPGGANFAPGPGAGSGAVCYSIVDMSLAAGMGSVTAKNMNLYGYISGVSGATSRISATRHCNGQDWWIVTTVSFQQYNFFQAYSLTATGISTIGVSSCTTQPTIINNGGIMKLSPNGRKIAFGRGGSPGVLLFDFDNSTGIVSNSVICSGAPGCFGIEFSPDGTTLYATHGGYGLNQWDLCSGTTSSSLIPTYTYSLSQQYFYHMQQAPDGKIYIGRGYNYLGVINNPNALGSSCNFSPNGYTLTGIGGWGSGLPNIAACHFYKKPTSPPFSYSSPISNCLMVNFSAPPSPSVYCQTAGYSVSNWLWNFGDPNTGILNSSNLTNPVHVFSAPGTYTTSLILNYSCGGGSDTLYSVVSLTSGSGTPSPTLAQSASTVCYGGSVSFTANAGSGPYTYSWSTGGNSTVTNIVSGLVSTPQLTITNSVTGCAFIHAFNLQVHPNSTITVASNTTTICQFDTVKLNASGASNYTWSTGSSNNPTYLTPLVTSAYTVTGTNLFGCANDATVSVNVKPSPTISATSSQGTICYGDYSILTGLGGLTYTWMPNAIVLNSFWAMPSATTTYTLIGSVSNLCTNSTTLTVVVNSCVGLDSQYSESSRFSVSPNPTKNGCSIIDLKTSKDERRVTIVNGIGELISDEKWIGTSIFYFDLSNGCSGAYLIYVTEKAKIVFKEKILLMK
jgi:PKD repeat protein